MSKFFSFLSDGNGNYFYADNSIRSKEKSEDVDSFAWLADFFKKNKKEDRLNSYEFNPFRKVLTPKKIVFEENFKTVEKWCNEIDWKKIIPEIIIKDIVNPFSLSKKIPDEKDIECLKEWSLSCNSLKYKNNVHVDDDLADYVNNSVCRNFDFTKTLWIHVVDSVRMSVYAYYSSFFDVKIKEKSEKGDKWVTVKIGGGLVKFKITPIDVKTKQDVSHNFSSLTTLWNKGLVPSFDGKTWRLHSGEKAEVVWEGSF